jgi:hypothetical protein
VSGYPILDLDLSRPRNVINDYTRFATAITSVPVNACGDAEQASLHHAQLSNYSVMQARLRNRNGLWQRQTSRAGLNRGK